MSAHPDRLYELMPVVYRMRDAEQGYALRDFLRVLSRQANVLEDDITRLYRNWFIETCDEWVVPYIGDLLGYSLLPEAATLGEDGAPALRLGRVLAPRADVANTIDARRRKGTLSLLQDLARDAAGWPAHPVEFYRLLGWMQHLDHQHPHRGGNADLRRPGPLQKLAFEQGAFEPFAHTVDVRRMSSRYMRGRFGIPDVGVFVFRLRSYRVTMTPAFVADVSMNCMTFSALGNDTPLFQLPEPLGDATAISGERNLPVPLQRYRYALRGNNADYAKVSPVLYGEGRSTTLWAPDWPSKGEGMPVPIERLIPADLSNWKGLVPRGSVAVDPECGRLMFPANQRPKRGAWVSYCYGFAADLGGGEYARKVSELENATRYIVHANLPGNDPQQTWPAGQFGSIADALAAWTKAKANVPEGQPPLRALIIELAESGVYEGSIDIQLGAGEAIQLRAAERTRPVLRLLDIRASQPDAFSVRGGPGSRLLLDGLLITGRGIDVQGNSDDEANTVAREDLCELQIRHCTLVPGWALHCNCDPKRPGEPSITLDSSRAALRIEHSIVGAIAVISPPRRGEPPQLTLCDSILDATGVQRIALGAPDEAVAYVEASFRRCTVIGEVQAHSVLLAEDSIFTSPLRVLRRQRGCVRFCYVPVGSRTPRRFHCQPDLALDAADQDHRESEQQRVAVQFCSLRYTAPDYARVADGCCEEIRSGASDHAQMGVYHDLYEPQREANLAVRLNEYTPAGIDAGILFAS